MSTEPNQMTALGLEYDSKDEAIRGAIFTLTALACRKELPEWLRTRAADESAALKAILANNIETDIDTRSDWEKREEQEYRAMFARNKI